jgi:hypothetical protein
MEKSTETLQKLKTEPPCSKGDEIKMKESSAAHIHGSTIPRSRAMESTSVPVNGEWAQPSAPTIFQGLVLLRRRNMGQITPCPQKHKPLLSFKC